MTTNDPVTSNEPVTTNQPVTTDQIHKQTMEHAEIAPTDALDRLLLSSDLEEPWYKSILRGFRERRIDANLPPLELTSKPFESSTFGDLNAVEQPWFKSLFSNLRDLINPPKLPPLEVTSKPVEVGTI